MVADIRGIAGRRSAELAGLDALELATDDRPSKFVSAWRWTWPKLTALGTALAVWQLVAWSGWRPSYVLPGPLPVLRDLQHSLATPEFWSALTTTMRRALSGFALATVLGLILGVAVSRIRPLRAALASLITGLQTMPSIAWFPLAILLFGLTEGAILFVVVLGAAPAIANGVIAGADNVPPLLRRVGSNLGARGLVLYRHIVLPAALPMIVSGLKQGWAFAWRSLMAGELLVILANRPSLGVRLQFAREFSDAPGLIATMVVILAIGLGVDGVFGLVERSLRKHRGLADPLA
jgi:NitT/TauT family transport system permease protein